MRVEDAAAGTGEGTTTPRSSGRSSKRAISGSSTAIPRLPDGAEVAESVRTAQAKRWASPAARSSWSPRCDLYLYPTSQSYAQGTGQPEVSPGISTMSNNGVRVLSRRMNLPAHNPLFLSTTLPHEVTHIVLADVFIAQQIPRWADEGLAVLAEPLTEQRSREAEIQGPLESGRIFQVGQLMAMDYPDQKDWRLFYAQSVSLTRFLVDQGPPERFLQFVRDSQRIGTAAALHDVYQIDGLTELQNRWVTHAAEAGRRGYGIEPERRFGDVLGHAVIAGFPPPERGEEPGLPSFRIGGIQGFDQAPEVITNRLQEPADGPEVQANDPRTDRDRPEYVEGEDEARPAREAPGQQQLAQAERRYVPPNDGLSHADLAIEPLQAAPGGFQHRSLERRGFGCSGRQQDEDDESGSPQIRATPRTATGDER